MIEPAEQFYTVPDWTHIDLDRQRVLDGDAEIASGVTIVATPGHTPGHQSLVVEQPDATVEVVVGQCCDDCAEFAAGRPAMTDLHDESMLDTGIESLARLGRLRPSAAHLSHDRTTWRRADR